MLFYRQHRDPRFLFVMEGTGIGEPCGKKRLFDLFAGVGFHVNDLFPFLIAAVFPVRFVDDEKVPARLQ